MLKKTITYVDYNGEEVTEDHYFNLSKMELVELEMGTNEPLSETLKKIVETNDSPKILRYFKDIVLSAYGIKSEDGRRFIKNQTIREEFEQTEACSELFIELATNADSAAAFMRGVIPASIDKDLGTQKTKPSVSAADIKTNPPHVSEAEGPGEGALKLVESDDWLTPEQEALIENMRKSFQNIKE